MRISDWSSDVCSSDLRAAGPDLLAVDAPMLAFLHGLRAQPRQVRARVRFGKALAPELPHPQAFGQEGLPLGLVADGHDDGAGPFLADGRAAFRPRRKNRVSGKGWSGRGDFGGR